MTPEQFVYWLQGFAEITDTSAGLTEKQWSVVKDHLKMVFGKLYPQQPKDKVPVPYYEPYVPLQPIPQINPQIKPDVWLKPPLITC